MENHDEIFLMGYGYSQISKQIIRSELQFPSFVVYLMCYFAKHQLSAEMSNSQSIYWISDVAVSQPFTRVIVLTWISFTPNTCFSIF